MSVKHVETSGYRSLSDGDVYPIVLYCNGIEAPLAAAEEQAKVISKAFNGKTVFVFHNTTDLNGYTRLTATSKASQTKLIANLAEVIKSYMHSPQTGKDFQVAIFAHSHGAYLLHHALEQLDSKEKVLVTAYTFGGISMIPKSLASAIKNYVFIEDKIAVSGSILYDPSNVLGRVMKIHQSDLLPKN